MTQIMQRNRLSPPPQKQQPPRRRLSSNGISSKWRTTRPAAKKPLRQKPDSRAVRPPNRHETRHAECNFAPAEFPWGSHSPAWRRPWLQPHRYRYSGTELMQVCVLGAGLLQDGYVGISIFPKLQEILVGNSCLSLVSQYYERPAEL